MPTISLVFTPLCVMTTTEKWSTMFQAICVFRYQCVNVIPDSSTSKKELPGNIWMMATGMPRAKKAALNKAGQPSVGPNETPIATKAEQTTSKRTALDFLG